MSELRQDLSGAANRIKMAAVSAAKAFLGETEEVGRSVEIKTQNQMLIEWFESGKTITNIEAWTLLGIPNARSRLTEVRRTYPLKYVWESKKANQWGQPSRYKRWSKA
jgi:hypothetical protein